MKVTRDRFEALAEAALREIPRRFRELIVDLEISVQARPGPEAAGLRGARSLLGLYAGLTRSDMAGPFAGSHEPARIILYQDNIQAFCRDEAELAREVRATLRHELAHHFGFTDEDLRRRWPEGA